MKSHVSLEQAQCPVCGIVHNTGSLLLDRRLRQSLDHHTVTHYAMCPEHQKLRDHGYVALIELSSTPRQTGLDESWPLRTGNLAHVRASTWANIFDSQPPKGGIAFVEAGVLQMLEAKVAT